MRVPTYTSQAKRSQSGGGQFLTASLNPSAMAAQGKAMSDIGNMFVEIGVKKMQIQTQTQVDQAEAKMLLELSEIQEKALMDPDPVSAEQRTKDAMAALLPKYTGGKAVGDDGQPLLTGRNARARFGAVGQGLISAQIIDFTKKNNARIVEFDRTNLDNSITKQINTISDPSLDMETRANA